MAAGKDFVFEELNTLSEKITESKGMPEDLRETLSQMVERLNRMARIGHYASEFDSLSRYIDVVTKIPWQERTDDTLDLETAKVILDRNHYGMEDVKDRILEYLATMLLIKERGQNAIARSPVLLLVGLQGVGKTTLAFSLAETLGRKFARIPVGAIGSALELRGKSKSSSQGEPGQIIKALIRTQVRNPVILLDEIEKASGQEGLRSDIMAILLEILDPSQNNMFRDHYIDYPVDLSEVLFICSANNTGTISTALMDRLEVIKMPSYTDAEKLVIAKNYLLPRIFENSGLKEGELTIDESIWPSIIRPLGFDTGIRSLGRTIETMCRKVAREIVEGKTQSVHISAENLKYYLPKY
ncbi:MAG: AAA family ATPase [Patescibacteria group bacterium]|jgi:ATP-dependent Lon protease